jgi:hypothetical protein
VSAFTLLEVLVGLFLAGILLTILARVAGTAYRIGHEEIERSSLETSILLAAKRLESDLLGSASAAISLEPAGQAVIIESMDGLTPSGRVLFVPGFLYWRLAPDPLGGRSVQRLMRSELSARPDGRAFDGNAFRWTPDQILALPPGHGDRPTLLLDGVTRFFVGNPAGIEVPQVGSPLRFEIEMELPIARTRKRIRIVRQVQVRTNGA